MVGKNSTYLGEMVVVVVSNSPFEFVGYEIEMVTTGVFVDEQDASVV